MAFNPPRYKVGDPIRSADVNAQNDEIKRLGWSRSGPGIIVRDGAGGRQFLLDLPELIFIRLTSVASGGGYAWEEVVMTSANVWTTTGRTGSASQDPAIEVQSGDTTLTADGTRYEARRGCCNNAPAWLFDGKN